MHARGGTHASMPVDACGTTGVVHAAPVTVQPESGQTLPRHIIEAIQNGADWLSSWWPPAVFVVLFVVLVGWLIARRFLHPHRRRHTWAFSPVLLVLVVCFGLAVANTVSGYVPSIAAAQVLIDGVRAHSSDKGRGQVMAVRVPVPADRHLDVSDTYVYTPPGYSKHREKRYPVVYLVHGTPGTASDWIAAGQIASTMDLLITEGTIRPMIVVAPDLNSPATDDTECLNASRADGPQVTTYLDHDVIDYVDAHFRTVPDRAYRAIGGFSMGGYCAIDRVLRSDRYDYSIAIEPYDNPGGGGRDMLASQAEFNAASPGVYLHTMTFRHPVSVFIDAGADSNEAEIVQAQRLADLLAQRGQNVTYRLEPGLGHTWTMARQAVAYGLVFVSRQLPEGS